MTCYDSYSSSSSTSSSPTNSSGYNSAESEDFYDDEEMTPTQLLALAIQKRRSLHERKDRDYRRQLLHTGMVRQLCQYLGAGRAKRRRSRRSRSRSTVGGKRKCSASASPVPEFIPLPPLPPQNGLPTPIQTPMVPLSSDLLQLVPPPPPNMVRVPCEEMPQATKRARLDDNVKEDPFGMDALFQDLYAAAPMVVDENAVPQQEFGAHFELPNCFPPNQFHQQQLQSEHSMASHVEEGIFSDSRFQMFNDVVHGGSNGAHGAIMPAAIDPLLFWGLPLD